MMNARDALLVALPTAFVAGSIGYVLATLLESTPQPTAATAPSASAELRKPSEPVLSTVLRRPVELPEDIPTEPSTASPQEPSDSERKDDGGGENATGLPKDIDYAKFSTAELGELRTKAIMEFAEKTGKEHMARHQLGLSEYLGVGSVEISNRTFLVSTIEDDGHSYKTELPEVEYPEFHAEWGRIQRLTEEIAKR